MNNITFNWVSMQNFFSVGEEVRVDFNEFNGMNYVYGENKDDDCRNGSGKCVTPETEIEIIIENNEISNIFQKFINNG